MTKKSVIFTFDKSYHISYNQDYFCCVGSDVLMYNRENGRLVAKLKGIRQPSCSKFMLDGRLVVKTTRGAYFIYDTETMLLLKSIPAPPKVKGSTSEFCVTEDGKYILDFSYVFPKAQFIAIEIESGICKFFDLGNARDGTILSTELSTKYYVITDCAETIDAGDVNRREYYKLTYESGRFCLNNIFAENHTKPFILDYAISKFFAADCNGKIKIFDIANVCHGEFEYLKDGILYDFKVSESGRFVVLVESRNVRVYDSVNGTCVKQFDVDYGCFADFIDDTKLLIGTWEKGYCVSLEQPTPTTQV